MALSNSRSLTGCLMEMEPVAAPVMETSPSVQLPAQVDLRPWCSPVEDQLNTNSCTANAVVGAMEFHRIRKGLPHVDLSRMYVYFNARRLAGTQFQDCGSFIHHVMAALMAHGVCEEAIWPFDTGRCLLPPVQPAYANGANYQAIHYGRTPLGVPAMTALANGLPVVFGTFIPHEFYDKAGLTGVMPMPGPVLTPAGSGHAMLLVGYDLPNQQWIIRNSWGPAWAEDGYCRVPFQTMAAYSIPIHFWTIGDIAAESGVRFSDDRFPGPDFDAPSHLNIDLTGLRQALRQRLASNVAQSAAAFHSRLRS